MVKYRYYSSNLFVNLWLCTVVPLDEPLKVKTFVNSSLIPDVFQSYLAALAGMDSVVKPRSFVSTHSTLDVQRCRRCLVLVLEHGGTFGDLRRRLRLQFDGVWRKNRVSRDTKRPRRAIPMVPGKSRACVFDLLQPCMFM